MYPSCSDSSRVAGCIAVVQAAFGGNNGDGAAELARLILHSADLCNPVLPRFEVVQDWAYRVCREFSLQVEEELALGFEPAPHMMGLDNPVAISRSQVFFIMYVVAPLWTAMSAILPELESARIIMERNLARWKALHEEEKAKAEAAKQQSESATGNDGSAKSPEDAKDDK